MKKKAARRRGVRPIDPQTGKPKRGRPRNEERAAQAAPAEAASRHVALPKPTTTTTPPTSTSDRSDDLQRALAELEPGQQGAAEGNPSGPAPTAADADEAAPILTPGDLVDVCETITALGVAGYAFFTRREIPDEERLKLSNGARKLCGITAQGTLDAAGPVLQQNAWIAQAVSPIGFGAALALHTLQKIAEVRQQPQRKPAARVQQVPTPAQHDPAPPAPRAAPIPPIPAPRVAPDVPPPIPGSAPVPAMNGSEPHVAHHVKLPLPPIPEPPK